MAGELKRQSGKLLQKNRQEPRDGGWPTVEARIEVRHEFFLRVGRLTIHIHWPGFRLRFSDKYADCQHAETK